MKSQVLLTVGVLSLAFNIYGQGSVEFRNSFSTAVTNVHTGQRVPTGTTFKAALYVAQDGVIDDSQYVAVAGDTGFTPVPGVFQGGGRTIYIAPAGAYVMLQVRVWETSYGSTYEAAEAAPPMNGRTALIGKSNRMRGRLANYTAVPPEPPTRLLDIGLQAFGVSSFPVPSLSISDVVVSEGTNGTKDVVFTVTLDPPADTSVSVDFATADGTATAGSDYVSTNGTLTFAAEETTMSISVSVTADVPPEPDESFYVTLSNAGGVPFVKAVGECVITEVRVTGVSVDVAVSFNTVPNRSYVVEKSDDIVNWSAVTGAENVAGTGGIVTVYDHGGGCQALRMYRARLLQ